VLEALGCDKILVETVGTGQDEVEIASVADTVLYVTTPSMGDEIQAMKAGAMEIGDLFVVNKADLAGKDKAVADLKAALGLGHSAGQAVKAWEPPVLATSAKDGDGVAELAASLEDHWTHLRKSGEGRARLKRQHATELQFWIQRRVLKSALSRVTDAHLESMVSRKSDPASVGRRLLGAR
jgi:LAO/AO transport system kinase